MRISKIVVSVYAKGLSANNFCHAQRILSVKHPPPPPPPTLTCPYIIANINDKPLAAIGKFPSVIGKLMIGKALSTNGGKLPML